MTESPEPLPESTVTQSPLDLAKASLRSDIRARRRLLSDAQRQAKSEAIAERVLAFYQQHLSKSAVTAVTIVSGFTPSRYELDATVTMKRLESQAGLATALPVVVAWHQPLVFRAWRVGEPLTKGNGAMQPLDDAPLVIPDLLLVPLIGFDRAGYRLGQGGGFYDRTLVALRQSNPRLVTIAIAFAEQEVLTGETIPRGQYDQRIDTIITDREVIRVT